MPLEHPVISTDLWLFSSIYGLPAAAGILIQPDLQVQF